jgi:hypothetical protein
MYVVYRKHLWKIPKRKLRKSRSRKGLKKCLDKILDSRPQPEFDIGTACGWIIKFGNQKSFDAVSRSMKIMEEGFKNKKPSPYTDKLNQWAKEGLKDEQRRIDKIVAKAKKL